jgi:hypothetical protein
VFEREMIRRIFRFKEGKEWGTRNNFNVIMKIKLRGLYLLLFEWYLREIKWKCRGTWISEMEDKHENF